LNSTGERYHSNHYADKLRPMHATASVNARPFLTGIGFGEGLRWHDGRLWFSDFTNRRVASVGPDGDDLRSEVELDDAPSGLGWLPDGRLLVVSMTKKRVLCRDADGRMTIHADLSSLVPADANDMVVAADGTAYIGNFGGDPREGMDSCATRLVVVRPDGTAEPTGGDVIFPNGAVITEAGELIVGETLAARYTAFPINPDGSLGAGRLWASVEGRYPDGCAIDSEGAIWFANAGGSEVVRLGEGGEILQAVPTPTTAYACALGGSDGRTLFIAVSPVPPSADAPSDAGSIYTSTVDIAA
jgi:sugar lactone lactonase YvrE